MKFVRYGQPNDEKPGVLDDTGTIRSLAGVIEDFGPTQFSSGLPGLTPDAIASLPLVKEGARIGACLADVPNFYCIGLPWKYNLKFIFENIYLVTPLSL